MTSVVELKLLFKGSDEPITLKDPEVIKKCPCLERAISCNKSDWETAGVIVEDPANIPFEKQAGDFLFAHIKTYTPPAEHSLDAKLEDYPEAAAKSLDELRQLIELANFLESFDFMNCMGFVIAKKLERLNILEIADFLGARREFDPDAQFFAANDGWIPAERRD